MGGRWREVWPWVGLVLLAAAVGGVFRWLSGAQDRDSAGALIQTAVTVLVAASGLAGWLLTQVRQRRTGGGSLPLERAADALAEQVRVQWEATAADRRLLYPAPVPVRWVWSVLPVAGPAADAVGDGSGPRRFAPLPGMGAATAETLAGGGLPDLSGMYGGLDSGRVVVLGAAGAGKTGAAIRLLLDALTHRATRDDASRARVPVPVLVTPHGWDPAGQPVEEWLADRLVRDYPLLRARGYGRDTAVRLIRTGLVSLVLDGLDDLPEPLRSTALRALDDQVTFRLVVLTRSQEMITAAARGHLSGTAALELQPVAANDAADYLARCRAQPMPGSWRHLTDQIRHHPDSAVARALDTPLMLTLVRDTYGTDGGVDELLDTDRFGTREAVGDHLLDRVLPAAYTPKPGRPRPRCTPEQAQRWLGHIAYRMNQDSTRDFAWWRIPTGAAGGHAGLAGGKGSRVPRQWGRPNWKDTAPALVNGFMLGCGYGLMAGFVSGLEDGFVSGLEAGLTVGLGFGLMLGPATGLQAFSRPAADPDSPITPLTCWRRDQLHGLVSGLVFGFVSWLVLRLLPGPGFGPVLGVGVASGVVLVSGLASSLTWRAALGFVRLRLSGRGPLRMMRFLEDARERQVLRTAGPVYQFRHARLQERLARPFERDAPGGAATPEAPTPEAPASGQPST